MAWGSLSGGKHLKGSGWSKEGALSTWRVRCPQHSKHQEVNSQGAAATPGQVYRRNIPEILPGTRQGVGGRGRRWNALKITSCERSFPPSYTLAIWIANTNLNINHFEKTYTCKYFSF